jgi:hypothetical protein
LKSFSQRSSLTQHYKTAAHLWKGESKSKDSSSNVNNYVDCGEANDVEPIKEEIDEEESVDDPLPGHQDNENREEDLYVYDTIDIEEFKIESDNVDINDTTNEDRADQDKVNNVNNLLVNNMDEEVNDVVDNVEENVIEVEENVVGQENINYEALQNLSVVEALAFFSS